jgi:hypothetical protein
MTLGESVDWEEQASRRVNGASSLRGDTKSADFYIND